MRRSAICYEAGEIFDGNDINGGEMMDSHKAWTNYMGRMWAFHEDSLQYGVT